MDPARPTLLVVDDNPENRDMLSRRLEKKGFTVRVCESGREALALLARDPIDLVLLDIMMPEMSGLEVLDEVRRTRSGTDLPVIMVTAKTDSNDVVEALEKGANDYVTKPLDFPVVLARIQAQLRIKTGRPEGPSGPKASSEVGPGIVLAGRYQLEGKIGSGGFGTVYRARHLDLERLVAVKVLQAPVNAAPDTVTRFRREGISACRIKHPNAVAVMDFGVVGNVAFLVMEMLEGRSLLDEINIEGRLTPERCAAILVPICGVLAEAHEAGVIHRDIKPSNIFLEQTAKGEVPKILDFGIAKIARGAASEPLTLDGAIWGTPAYMAPERFRAIPYDGKSDVYSLGVMLYQMLAGRLPFDAPLTEPMAVIAQHLNATAPALSREGLSFEVEAVVTQAMRKDPALRPTALEMGRNLARAVGMTPETFEAASSYHPSLPVLEPITSVSTSDNPTEVDPRLSAPATNRSEFTPLDEATLPTPKRGRADD